MTKKEIENAQIIGITEWRVDEYFALEIGNSQVLIELGKNDKDKGYHLIWLDGELKHREKSEKEAHHLFMRLVMQTIEETQHGEKCAANAPEFVRGNDTANLMRQMQKSGVSYDDNPPPLPKR